MVRFKNRYLVLEVLWADGKCDESITTSSFAAAIRDSLAVNFGDYGVGRFWPTTNGELT
jgi:RNase P/RNase MRP subunit POP5